MSLTPEDMHKLDMQSEHGAMLATAETLEALAKIADDPMAYDPVLFDAAYTRAEQLAHSFCGMMMGLRAAEIAATFRRAVKARKACEKYDLVPKAALEAARPQTTTHASFGPGDPFPDPPPTKPLTPWTAESLRRAYCAHVGGPRLAAWDMLGAQTRRMFEALAYVANVRMGIESP